MEQKLDQPRWRYRKLGPHKLGVMATGCCGVSLAVAALEPADVLNYRIGNVQLRPHFNSAFQYDSNIFFRDKATREDDFLTIVNPGFGFLLGDVTRDSIFSIFNQPVVFDYPRNFIRTDYDYRRRFFADHSEQNSGDQEGSVAGHIEHGRVTLDGNVRIARLSSILGGTSGINGSVDRTTTNVAGSAEADLTEKSVVTLSGGTSKIDYASGTPLNDTQDTSGSVSYGFNYSRNIRLSSGVTVGTRTSTSNGRGGSDFSQNFFTGFVEASGLFTQRLRGRVRVGAERRNSSEFSETSTDPVVSASLTQVFLDRTAVTVSFSRAVTLDITTPRTTSSTSFGVSLSRVLGVRRKWLATLDGSYLQSKLTGNEFFAGDRTDKTPRLGARLTYQIQEWLAASLDYSFEKLNTSGTIGSSIVDYDVNRITLSVAVGY